MEYQTAIDTIIQFAGETPVNAPNQHPLQGNIELLLNNTIAREQLYQWWFNKDTGLWFTAQEDGRVRIPAQIKAMVFVEPQYIDRGSFVYDKESNTFLIHTNVETVETTRQLEWDELPELMQQWCMFQAAKYYIVSTIGDTGVTKELKEEAKRTYVLLNAQDIKSKNINVFNTYNASRMKYGRRPYGGR
jgi:hypothetical protein